VAVTPAHALNLNATRPPMRTQAPNDPLTPAHALNLNATRPPVRTQAPNDPLTPAHALSLNATLRDDAPSTSGAPTCSPPRTL